MQDRKEFEEKDLWMCKGKQKFDRTLKLVTHMLSSDAEISKISRGSINSKQIMGCR